MMIVSSIVVMHSSSIHFTPVVIKVNFCHTETWTFMLIMQHNNQVVIEVSIAINLSIPEKNTPPHTRKKIPATPLIVNYMLKHMASLIQCFVFHTSTILLIKTYVTN